MRRASVYAGAWYPADLSELDALIRLPESNEGTPVRYGILPHAGLYFSARGIAPFFARLDKDIQRILILSPSHYYYLEPNQILTDSRLDETETLYGDRPMLPLSGFQDGGYRAIQREHAVEMVLPFIGKYTQASVSMGLISQVDEEQVEAIADKLLHQIDSHTAVIASSDFTHYGEGFSYIPYGARIDTQVRQKVQTFDQQIATQLAEGNWKTALKEAKSHHATICGIAPSSIVSCMAQKQGLKGSLVDSYDSWDLSGGGESFVSYQSVLWG